MAKAQNKGCINGKTDATSGPSLSPNLVQNERFRLGEPSALPWPTAEVPGHGPPLHYRGPANKRPGGKGAGSAARSTGAPYPPAAP